MTQRLRPPTLDLRDEASIRWRSFTKIIRQPEENWPIQILRKPIITRRVGDRTLALIADPDATTTIFAGSEDQFPNWRIYERVVGGSTGHESLLAVAGAKWRRQRRAFGPMFREDNADRLVPLFRSAAERAAASWASGGAATCLDASLAMTRLTLEVIWRALFDAEPESDPPPIVARTADEIHAAHLRGDLATPPRKIAELADAAASRTHAKGVVRDNPYDNWGAVSGDPEGALTRQELYDNACFFLGAGHETTALTLTWALWLAALDQETQQRVQEEIAEVVGDGPIEATHLERLVFTGAVLSETMRLYPSALATVRQAKNPAVLAGEQLPAGTVLVVCFYALHRHESLWEAPDEFRPERFLPGAGEPRHRYAYLPFSAGRHACIGATFGWREVMTVFATILQRFRVTTDPSVSVNLRMAITPRPDREVPIVLHRRGPAEG